MASGEPRAAASDGLLPRGPYAISPEIVAADQRRRLLAAAPEAIAEHGFEALTVEHVVKIAAVRRNAFYEQFEDKGDCVAAAYEAAQERLLGAITFQCYSHADPAERIGSALEAGAAFLGAEPALARLLAVESLCAGDELARRHYRWLDRYGRMLRFAAVGAPGVVAPQPATEPAIVGGIASRVKELLLAGEAERIADLGPELASFALSFYELPEPRARFVDREPAQPQSAEADGRPAPAAAPA